MPATPPITVRLDDETRAELQRISDELAPALQAAGDLATAVGELLEFIPPDVSPVVLTLDRLAPLQAALDSFVDTAGGILERPAEPDPPARELEPAEPPARELDPDDDPVGPLEGPGRTPPPARELPDELLDSDELGASERIERGNARKMLEAAHRRGSCSVVIGAERRAAERLEDLGLVTYNRDERRVEVPA